MKITLDMAISLNGMVARDDGSEDWLPFEGWTEFLDQAKLHNNIIMGRETYEKVTDLYKDHNFDDVNVTCKIIVTRNRHFIAPSGYSVVYSPSEALQCLKDHNIDHGYLIGGGVLNSEFIKQGLVSHMNLTVTPFILGSGRPFIAKSDFETNLTLMDSHQLSGGRLRLAYSVNKE